jgi:hypothetical protein
MASFARFSHAPPALPLLQLRLACWRWRLDDAELALDLSSRRRLRVDALQQPVPLPRVAALARQHRGPPFQPDPLDGLQWTPPPPPYHIRNNSQVGSAATAGWGKKRQGRDRTGRVHKEGGAANHVSPSLICTHSSRRIRSLSVEWTITECVARPPHWVVVASAGSSAGPDGK